MLNTEGFEPIDRRTVADEVRQRLLDRIREVPFNPARVPSERSLCEQFQVARTSIREAMQGLVSLGVIERRGNRAYVTERLPTVVVEADGRKERVRELFEVRRVIEIPLFEMAACRATESQRAEIDALAHRFAEPLDLAGFRRLDRAFHSTIAAACANPLLAELYAKVLDALFGSDAFASLLEDEENADAVAELIDRSGRDHVAIAAAVAGGDPVSTAAAVEAHLSHVEQRMTEQLV